jgi:hypothetical protein
MSDESNPIMGGGSTAGLRDAALAKRAAKQEAPAAKPTPKASEGPTFAKKPTPSADSANDDEARKQHRKLPTKQRAANDNAETDLDLAGIEADEPADDNAGASTGDVIKIGDFEIPASVLEQIPDDVLKRIKRKVKAGGEDIEITIAEALESVPQARGWQKRMWEASQHEKTLKQQAQQLEAIAQSMGTDAIGAIARMYGVTRQQATDAISQQLIGEMGREEHLAKMSPEERARFERMDDLERKAEKLRQLEEQETKRAQEAEQARHRERYVQSMRPALEAVGLPVTPRTVRDVANMVATMMEDGLIKGDATPDDLRWAASELAKEIAKDEDARLPEDGEALIAKLGDKRAKLVAQAYARRVQQAQRPQARSPEATKRSQSSNGRQKFSSFSEWKRWADAQAKKNDRAAGRG